MNYEYCVNEFLSNDLARYLSACEYVTDWESIYMTFDINYPGADSNHEEDFKSYFTH